MKKMQVAIPTWMAAFYYPIALLGLLGAGFTIGAMSELYANMWVKIPLLAVGSVMQLAGFIGAIYMAYILGKSIVEDKKE